MKKDLIDPLTFFIIALMYLLFDYNFGMISMLIFCGISLLVSNLGREYLYLQAILFVIFGLLRFIVYQDSWLSVILVLIGLVIFIFYFRGKMDLAKKG